MAERLDILEAMRCLQQLASAPDGGLTPADIASLEGLDRGAIGRTLAQFARAELVRATGPRYELARDSHSIRVADAQDALPAHGPLGAYGRMSLAELLDLEDRFFADDATAHAS